MLSYKKAGVDIKKAGLFKKRIASEVKKTFSKEVLAAVGGFGSLFSFSKKEFKEPVLVSSADGVGTKLKIAVLVNKHDTVGIDCVAMNVNDILCTGARPLFFLDYISFAKLNQKILPGVIKGLNQGCLQAGCSLIGGETAQMPDMYNQGEYDLAGFCVGVVEKKRIISGCRIEAGDALIGIESNGLHSNGFSLVRKVFSRRELKRYALELLKPTRIYAKPILSLLYATRSTLNATKAIAHITGGAFYDKIDRVLPAGLNARVYKNSWVAPAIFRLIQNKGEIPEREMYHTFNMGIGMVLIINPKSIPKVKGELIKFKLKSWEIGKIVKGRKEVEIV
ncbi:MAG: phosphoribosylformylglycinamidine cyclo-ligase [Candidatus Omnitrophica bacterium]|nr:phosphoribosylformylglycinamidine cyclo-ligase [Candidatus Omnitrophota bacterium]